MLEESPSTQDVSRCPSKEVHQAGAICYRRGKNGKMEVLLVVSRRNGRWGVPKGHIEAGEYARQAAEREAIEEGGVSGKMSSKPFGSFCYEKGGSSLTYRVTIYLLEVLSTSAQYVERGSRETKWVSVDDLVDAASRPCLKPLLQRFSNLVGTLSLR